MLAALAACGVLAGALVRRRGPVRGAVALGLTLLPVLGLWAGRTLFQGVTLHVVGPAVLYAGVPLAVMATHAAVRHGRDSLTARTGLVIAVIEALGLMAAVVAGVACDLVA
jgi:hypothetical protein